MEHLLVSYLNPVNSSQTATNKTTYFTQDNGLNKYAISTAKNIVKNC